MSSTDASADSEKASAASVPLEALLRLLRSEQASEASAAVSELIRRFQPLIRKFWIQQRIGEYDDFLQEILVRLFGSLPHLRDLAAFPGFLRRIVVSTAADQLRQKYQHDEPRVDIDVDSLAQAFDQDLTTPLMIRAVLDRLPPRERQVIVLAYLEDMDSEAIARLTGLTAGAVRMTRSRALSRLREIFASEAGGNDAFCANRPTYGDVN